MSKSKGSPVVVGDERSKDALTAAFVVPNHSGQREQALEHAHDYTLNTARAMARQVEPAFQGVVHRLDDLTQRFEETRLM